MNDEDTARAAGIPAAIAYAIRVVESGSKPHPHAVRFEPRLWNAHRPDHPLPYTPPKGTRAETDRGALDHAMELDAATAVVCASFGARQVMGAHLLAITGKPPVEAVAAFDADADGLSQPLFVHWIRANKRFVEEANKPEPDFDRLALLYNGKLSYADSLRAAYDSFVGSWPERG